LNPYGFFWFELPGSAEPVDVRTPPTEALVTLDAPNWKGLFESETGEILENTVLPKFLAEQSWFAGKAKAIDAIHIHDWAEFETAAAHGVIAFLRVRYHDGMRETYFAPMAINTTQPAFIAETMPERVLCRVNTPEGAGVLYDGGADDETCRALLACIDAGAAFNTRRGTIRPRTAAGYRKLREAARRDCGHGLLPQGAEP
jgi:maltose alpha-D-glucosyltransferase/alpha-amylase